MRRGIVERIGFFDERFGPGTSVRAAEDHDYILRAYLAGITIEYVPDMLVFHYHGRKLVSDGKKLLRNYTTGYGALYAKYLFKYPDVCRPFYWDIKNSMNEITSGSNTFLPDIGFSHKEKLVYSILGAIKFFAVSMRRSA
jgi:GT2 family glycosyltransferase